MTHVKGPKSVNRQNRFESFRFQITGFAEKVACGAIHEDIQLAKLCATKLMNQTDRNATSVVGLVKMVMIKTTNP